VDTGIRLSPGLRIGMLSSRRQARDRDLTRRQRLIVEALSVARPTPIARLQEACRSGHTAVVEDLGRLVAGGLVRRQGRARATRYLLVEDPIR
jgi:hypothetical protein